jgi:hypothetical protein
MAAWLVIWVGGRGEWAHEVRTRNNKASPGPATSPKAGPMVIIQISVLLYRPLLAPPRAKIAPSNVSPRLPFIPSSFKHSRFENTTEMERAERA